MDTVLPSSLSQLPTTSMNRKENKDLEETEENRRIQDCLYTYHRSDKKKSEKEWIVFFLFSFLVEVWLIYNVMLVSTQKIQKPNLSHEP